MSQSAISSDDPLVLEVTSSNLIDFGITRDNGD
jgi:hypothetical protein